MHLLTGLLVGELLLGGKLLKGRRGPRPGFNLKHVLPGRVRFEVPVLKGDDEAARGLADALGKLDGVSQATADPRTGSLLLLFDDGETTRHEIIGLLNRFTQQAAAEAPDGPEAPAESDEPLLRQRVTELGRSLNTAVQQETKNVTDLHTLLGLGIGVWGLKTLIAPGPSGRLPGLTWLYWSYNLLRQPSPAPGRVPEEGP